MSAYQQGPEAGGFQQQPAGAPPGAGLAPQGPPPGGPGATMRPVQQDSETKAAFKTTELIAYVVTVLGVLIASAVVDENDNGQGFDAERAWLYVTMLTIGYLVSRGLAKAGSRHHER